MIKKLLTLSIAMTVLIPFSTGAAEKPAPGTEARADGNELRPTKPLSLRDAIERAVANNLQVAIRKLDPESARLGVTQAQSAFDPLVSAAGTYDKSKDEPLSDFASRGRKSWNGSATWSQVLQEGFRYSATWDANKVRSIYPANASSLGFFNPITQTYGSSLSLRFQQPLLRGFGFDVNRTDIEIARLGVSTSEESFRNTLITTLARVQEEYWVLCAAISNLEVQRASLKLAQDLLGLNRKKVEVGTLAPIQITEAEASVASREEGVILAEAAITNAEDTLRFIMNVPPDAPEWGLAINPTDKPTFEPSPIDLGAMLKAATDNRPELREGKDVVRSNELRLRFSENARKPGLDAVASYTPRGNNYDLQQHFVDLNRDGTSDDLDADGTADLVNFFDIGGYSDSAREVFSNDVYTWSVGLNFTLPIGNRNAKASVARNRIALDQARMSLESVERSVMVEVRAAVRAVETGVKRVTAARSNIVLQEKKLEAEQKRYDNGMSTSFQVLSFQNDLTSARFSEIDAIRNYNVALVELGRVTATLPERSGVRVATR